MIWLYPIISRIPHDQALWNRAVSDHVFESNDQLGRSSGTQAAPGTDHEALAHETHPGLTTLENLAGRAHASWARAYESLLELSLLELLPKLFFYFSGKNSW